MGSPLRFILVGVDGFQAPTAQRFANEGALPNITRLMERGACGELLPRLPSWTPTNFRINGQKEAQKTQEKEAPLRLLAAVLCGLCGCPFCQMLNTTLNASRERTSSTARSTSSIGMTWL